MHTNDFPKIKRLNFETNPEILQPTKKQRWRLGRDDAMSNTRNSSEIIDNHAIIFYKHLRKISKYLKQSLHWPDYLILHRTISIRPTLFL